MIFQIKDFEDHYFKLVVLQDYLLFIWIFITPFNYTIAKIIHIKYKATVQKAQEGLALTTGLEFIYTILFENETKNKDYQAYYIRDEQLIETYKAETNYQVNVKLDEN